MQRQGFNMGQGNNEMCAVEWAGQDFGLLSIPINHNMAISGITLLNIKRSSNFFQKRITN